MTARAGSKRLPDKNIRPLCGHPLFVWSVKAALAAASVSRIIVSTDSPYYREIALKAGADCPWLRPPELATDTTSSADVVADMLDRLGDELARYRGLVLLQPTSPLRVAADIEAAIGLYEARQAPAVVTVSEAECPPAWMGQLPADGCMDHFVQPQFRGIRSQDLGLWYRLNGAVYVIGIDTFQREHGFMPTGTLGYVMPRERSVDVDTAFDFQVANALMSARAHRDT
ncbi:MAG: acylneuraminate cytidylyltransferase family protein [Hydrogenophaga sp.]|uniref:acylneuraminate cytidylyltransferase family protein n=1 Tax=Hydrogenophaga sp. TaxID=1904254 RepID=UPI001E15229B|nr:acylneuraminate cytidylyltransferase family protein [Hydrogenophaga sp.]MBX3611667.1 acylneuraminate cytidylyltransferase family protein [Hydrogenophaga sp.]